MDPTIHLPVCTCRKEQKRDKENLWINDAEYVTRTR